MATAVKPSTGESLLAEGPAAVKQREPRVGRRSALSFAVLRGDQVRASGDLNRGAEWVGLLPKSKYLIRVISLPTAPLDELREMVRLKTEATLPADYGPIETGFRRLGVSEVGMEQLEVYAAKRRDVDACVESLGELGGRVVAVLPSASVWVEALVAEDAGRRDLLMAPSEEDAEGEAAFLNPDGSIAVRHLGQSDTAIGRRTLEESVRAAGSVRQGDGGSVGVGWLGPPLKPVITSASGLGWFDDRALLADAEKLGLGDWLLRLADGRVIGGLAEANLMPRSLRLARRRRQAVTRLLVGAVAGLASLGLLVGALKIHTARHVALTQALKAEIAEISADGEAVGWKLAQLEALASARATRNDFAEVLYAVHEASPASGLSFSHLELETEGMIQMRGQAESLAMPFELPQQLEARDVFSGVLLRDAGQAKKGGGSVTEFRLEARHERKVRP